MSKEIEERVVEMRFDNKNFEKNVSETMSTLDKLKEKLNFRGVEKSFDGISSSARGVNLSPISGAVDTVIAKFSAFDAIAFSVLQNLTNRAISAGEQLVKSLTIDQIGAGWHKYEDETKAVQTIVNATGKSIEEVEDELARLSWFTDETSYSYIDMVSNVGKFTSMNIPLNESVTAMEGIANWAAVSGQGINEASHAMYNLSQAMGAGVVKLQDWKSIVNAQMATAEFKQTAIDTAKALGLLTKAGKTVKGNLVDVVSFDNTLQDAWFTKDVLMETLKKYGAYSDKVYDFMQKTEDASLTCAEAMDLVSAKGVELGAKAFRAGQEAKTATEAIDSVKDAVSTGWKDTFKIIFGNYEQAKILWTDLANDLWEIFASGSESRNKMFEKWAGAGGRDDVIGAMKNALKGLKQVIDIVKESFHDIFPPLTAERLKKFSESLNKFSKKLILSDEKADKLHRTLKGLFAVLDIFRIVITDMVQIGLVLFNTLLGKSTDKIGDMTANMGDSIVSFRDWIKEHDHSVESIKKICDKIATARDAIKKWIDDHVHLRESLSKLREHIQNGAEKVGDFAKKLWELPAVQGAISKTKDILKKFFGNAKEYFSEGYDRIKEFIDHLKTLDGFSFENIKDAVKSFKDIVLDHFFNIEGGVDKLKSVFWSLKDSITGSFSKAGDSMDSFRDKITNFGKLVREKAEAATDFSFKWATTSNNLKTYANNAKKRLKEVVDVGDLLSIALGGTLILSIKNISDAFKTLNGMLKTFTNPLDALTGVFKGLKGVFDAYAKKIAVDATTKMIKAVAVALAVLVGIVVVLSKLAEKGTMWDGIYGLLTLAGTLVAVVAAFALINKFLGSLKIDVGIQASVIAIAAAVAILVKAVKMLDGVQNMDQNVLAIAVLATLLSLLAIAITKLSDGLAAADGIGIAILMIGIAAAILILVKALDELSTIKFYDVGESLGMLAVAIAGLAGLMLAAHGISIGGAIALVTAVFALKSLLKLLKGVKKNDIDTIRNNLNELKSVFLMFAGIMVASRFSGANASKVGTAILAMSISLIIIIQAFKMIAKMSTSDLLKGELVVDTILAIFGVLTVLSKKSGENAAKAGVMILLMSGALLIVAGAVKIFSSMSVSELEKGVAAVGVLELLMGAVVAMSKNAGDAKNTLIGMSIAIGVMAVALIALSFIEWDRLLPAAGSLTAVILALAAALAATKGINKDLKGMATIVLFALIIAEFAAALYFLADKPWKSLIAGAAGLSLLLLVLAESMKILGEIESVSTKVVAQLILLSLVTIILGGVLAGMQALSQGNMRSAIQSAIAIGILLVALSESMLILDKIKINLLWSVVAQIAVMTVIAGALGMLLVGMQVLSNGNMSSAIQSAVAISILLGALVIATGLFSLIPPIPPIAFVSLGVMVVALGLIALILGLLAKFDISLSIENILALSIMLFALVAACVPMALIGALGPSVIAGAAIFDAVIVVIGALLVGIGALMEYVPQAEEFLNKGVTVLQMIGEAIGGFFGNLIDGFMNAVTENIQDYADRLSGFMEGLQPFIEGAKKIDKSTVTGVMNLARMFAVIAGVNVLNSISAFLSFGQDPIAAFGARLILFGTAIRAYSAIVSGVNKEAMDASINAGAMLSELENSLSKHGLVPSLFGKKDIAEFGARLLAFGAAIKGYSMIVSTGINNDAVYASVCAGSMLVVLENHLSKHGLVPAIMGEQSLAEFSVRLLAFGAAIKGYSMIVSTGIDSGAVEASVTAGTILATLENSLSKHGLIPSLMGDQDLEDFGDRLEEFGKSLRRYSNTITKDGGIDVGAIIDSGTAVEKLAEISNSLKNNKLFTNETWLDDFGDDLKGLGEGLKSYSDSITSITFVEGSNIEKSIACCYSLGTFMKTLPDNKLFKNETTLYDFGRQLGRLGSGLKKLFNSVGDIDDIAVTNAISFITRISETATKLLGFDTSGIDAFGNSLKDLGKNGLKSFAAGFSDDGVQNKVKAAGRGAVGAFMDSVKEKDKDVKTVGMELMAGLIAVLRVYQGGKNGSGGFYGVGEYVIEGFANGIAESSYIAEAAARKAAENALLAAQARLDENSPSKEFYKIGHFAVLGMANALTDGSSTIYDSGYGMAGNAVSGLKKAIVGISDMIESDIDTQPTIRPVLDLSDIQNGTDRMSRMLGDRNLNFSATTAGTLSSDISAMFSAKDNSDMLNRISRIESSIDSLGDRIDGMNVVMDSGALVGQIVAPMDRALGQQTVFANRGI